MQQRSCKICGCTDDNACIHPDLGACWWVDDDLCSFCAAFPNDKCVERPADRIEMEGKSKKLTAYVFPGLKTVDDCISEAFKVTVKNLQDPRRIRQYVDARKFAMWWQRKTFGKKKSFAEIGRMYAGKDHAVALKAFKTDHNDLMETDSEYRSKANEAIRMLNKLNQIKNG